MKQFLKPRTKRALLYLIIALGAAQVLLGGFWILRNLGHIPQYGDTPEYLRLAQTLALDNFRTILYPLFLRGPLWLSTRLPIPYQTIVYLCQLIVSYLSLLYLFTMLRPVSRRGTDQTAKRQSVAINIGLALFVFTTPLVAHYNLSVLSDSFALSFTIIFVASLVGLFAKGSARYGYGAAVMGAYTLMAITRPERLLIGLAVAGAVALYFAVAAALKHRIVLHPKVIILIVAIAVGFAGATIINNYGRGAAAQRTQPSLAVSLYARVTWPRLAKAYKYLPADIKKIITREDAITSDRWPTYYNRVVLDKILGHKHGGAAAMNRITEVTWSHYYPEIVWSTVGDFTGNLLAPATEALNFAIRNQSTDYVESRMSAGHPALTKLYRNYSAVLLGLLIIIAIFAALRRIPGALPGGSAAAVILTFIGVFALFFALFADPIVNIRYMIPIYVLEYGVMVSAAAAYLQT